MGISLHVAVVGTWQQLLPQVAHMLDKAEAHCRENNLPDEALTQAALAPDMWPFAKQVMETAHHSARALDAVRAGLFGPELDPAPTDFATLRSDVEAAIAAVAAVDPGELDAIAERDMVFAFRDFRREFTVSDFLLSFTLPNFYFHLATAYGILRSSGVKLSKFDYLGKLRTKS